MSLQNPQNEAWEAEVVQRVRSGMSFLAEKYGPDWVDMFTEDDMEALDLKQGACCVLGTIHKHKSSDQGPDNYFVECSLLKLNPYSVDAARLGFYIHEQDGDQFGIEDNPYDDMASEESWDVLTAAWRKSISSLKQIRGKQ